MKKIILLFAMILLPMVAGAETVEIDGIYYNLISKGKAAEVTSNPNKYSGSVVIPASVTYEGVEYNVTSIGVVAFSYCSGLTSVTIGNSVTSIGQAAFYDCSGLSAVHISDLAAWCKISFSDGSSNPLSYAHHLYLGDEEIKDLVIPNGVTSIGSCAFYSCSGLTTVTIPSSVTSIGISAFSICSGLTSITIPNSVTSIGSDAFYGCSGLTTVTIPNSVTSIGISAFEGCSGLTAVTIPNSVTSIKQMAFSGCSGLTSLTIPNSVKSIGSYAFSGCSGLTSVTIPSSVTSIEHMAFSGCSGLTSLTIPNSVKSIGSGAFYGCSGLSSVTIPNSVTSLGKYAFQSCSGLTSVTIPNSVTSIGDETFRGCSGLTSVTIPNGVTSIGERAFAECSGLTSVTIPNSVTSLGKYAFQSCSGLTSVTIGSGVKNIYSQAFAYCKELSDVYCLAEAVPGTIIDAFQDSYIEYATLHVPTASIDAYKAKEPWKNFKEIKSLTSEDIPDTPDPEKCTTPTIAFVDGKLKFSCSTEGVEYVYEIKDTDIKKGYDSEVQLSATYEISVYATKAGWENSNVATATLVWGNATFTETTHEESSVRAVKREVPALVTIHGGTIAVQSEADGLPVAVYAADGQLYGSSIVSNGQTTVSTNLQAGSIAIVKIGDKAVKVVVK